VSDVEEVFTVITCSLANYVYGASHDKKIDKHLRKRPSSQSF